MAGIELDQAFDFLMARAGIAVPPDRRDTLLAAFKDLQGQLALLHGPHAHQLEPAGVFRLALPASAA